MSATLKLVLPIALVVVVVFGLTIISTSTPDQTPAPGQGGTDAPKAGVPLRFGHTEIAPNPNAEEPATRYYPGFYEMNGFDRMSFWFRNPNPNVVKTSMLGRSCSACTSARIASVPDAAMNAFFANVAAGSLLTAGHGPDLLTPLAAAVVLNDLKWQNMDFERPDATVDVAAATDGRPSWGVFQIGLDIKVIGPKSITAKMGSVLAPGQPTHEDTFAVTALGMDPFDLAPAELNFGELAEGATARTQLIRVWSATREPADLPTPKVIADTDGFVTVGPPAPLSPADLTALAAEILAEKKLPLRVKSGYAIPVTVNRHPAGGEPDIGKFERAISVSMPGVATGKRATVKGNVVGLVKLTDGAEVKLGSFTAAAGQSKTVRLESDRPGLELAVVPGECVPNYLRATLDAPVTAAGVRTWNLKVTVPPKVQYGDLPKESVVVLKTTTGPAVKVRIPVQGTGFGR